MPFTRIDCVSVYKKYINNNNNNNNKIILAHKLEVNNLLRFTTGAQYTY